jgi:hypothetical protein
VEFARPGWGNAEGEGIHWELFVDYEELGRGNLVVGLDIGERVADREAKRSCLARLLRPYERTLLDRFGLQVRPHKLWKFLYATIPLLELTVEAMKQRSALLPDLAAFVDEALFLADKVPVWRSDFFSDDPPPGIRWAQWKEYKGTTGETGGWEVAAKDGRLDSPCLRCHANGFNYRDCFNRGRPSNILRLRRQDGGPIHEITNDQEVYACAVIHSATGGQLQFYGEATKEGRFVTAFAGTLKIPSSEAWQVIKWRGKLDSPADYDFAKQGLNAFIMLDVPETALRIDSIEIGRCGSTTSI